jgi:Ribonuclease T2 family
MNAHSHLVERVWLRFFLPFLSIWKKKKKSEKKTFSHTNNKKYRERMQKLLLIVIIGVVATLLCNEVSSHTISNPDTDVFMLSLQQCNSSSPWTVHGLWPQNATCCPGPKFSMSEVMSIKPQLDEHWPSCPQYSDTNEQLWSHEWMKHGRCSGMDEMNYFEEAMTLAEKYGDECPTGGNNSCKFCFSTTFKRIDYSFCDTHGSYPNC